MGDRLRFKQDARTREKQSLHGVWVDGVAEGRVVFMTGNRLALLVWHRWSRKPLGSWVMSVWDYQTLRVEWECDPMAKFLKTAQAAAGDNGGDPMYAARDKEFAKDHPAIVEYLTLKKDDSGADRQTSSLLVFCEQGMWKACLSERDKGLTLWASGDTLAGLLEALEGILQSPNPQWRMQGKRTSNKK